MIILENDGACVASAGGTKRVAPFASASRQTRVKTTVVYRRIEFNYLHADALHRLWECQEGGLGIRA
jgi:hypothetical protein